MWLVTATMPPRKRRALTDVARYIAHLHIHCLCCSTVASRTSWVCGVFAAFVTWPPMGLWRFGPVWPCRIGSGNADIASCLSCGLPRGHRLGWLIALTTLSVAAMPPYHSVSSSGFLLPLVSSMHSAMVILWSTFMQCSSSLAWLECSFCFLV
jgi:hypothetical protein